MKNKIGILENDIYIFPIVNSVNLLVHSFGRFAQFWDGLEGSTAYVHGAAHMRHMNTY